MSFRYERDMVGPAKAWLESRGLLTKREFPTPWGICDVVGCSLNRRNADRRIRLGQTTPIGSFARVRLFCMMPDQEPVDIKALCRIAKDVLRRDELLQGIQHLIVKRFVQVTNDGEFLKRDGWVPLKKRIVAVELKLDRISDALNQAIGHLAFADESYVGLPWSLAKRVSEGRKKEEFTHSGIGILGVKPDQCEVMLRACDRSQASPIAQAHCVERFWKPYLRGTST